MRVVFLVIASDDPVHQADLEVQRQTWAASIPSDCRVVWLRGSENNVANLDGDTLFVPCREIYKNILEKTLLGVRYVLENMDFDILVRTNVSTYFDSARLIAELDKKYYSDTFFGGYIDKTSGGYFGQKRAFEYISGTGVFLSRDAAAILSNMNSEEFSDSPDDVAISHYLSSQGIPLVRMLRNNLSSTHIFLPSFFTRTKSSADASLAGARMVLLHQYFSSSKLIQRVNVVLDILKLEISAFSNHPEPKIRYLQRNRIVLLSYIKTKGWQLWKLSSRY
jgi:hypothetical protein